MIGNSSRKDEALDRLASGIAQLTSSETWTAWLRVQARFHSYSFNNTVLILGQRPAASRIAGFHTWRRLGRFVRRGEQAVWILAPVTRRANDDESEKAMRTVVGFRPVAVFSEDQTDGEPLPEVCTRLYGDEPAGVFAELARVAQSFGFAVENYAFDDETNGDCSHVLRRIRIKTTLEPMHRAKTLAHELGHALLHFERTERGLMEIEAESVAFIVCNVLGIDAGAWTFGYITTWSGGGDQAIAAIRAAGTRIQRTAEHILSELNLANDGAAESMSEGET
jgi:antirestriction protein ArdC